MQHTQDNMSEIHFDCFDLIRLLSVDKIMSDLYLPQH